MRFESTFRTSLHAKRVGLESTTSTAMAKRRILVGIRTRFINLGDMVRTSSDVDSSLNHLDDLLALGPKEFLKYLPEFLTRARFPQLVFGYGEIKGFRGVPKNLARREVLYQWRRDEDRLMVWGGINSDLEATMSFLSNESRSLPIIKKDLVVDGVSYGKVILVRGARVNEVLLNRYLDGIAQLLKKASGNARSRQARRNGPVASIAAYLPVEEIAV